MPWGVRILLKFWQFSSELSKTGSSGASECGVWIGNCNVKVWKSTEHKLHKIWRSVKFEQNEHTPAGISWGDYLVIVLYSAVADPGFLRNWWSTSLVPLWICQCSVFLHARIWKGHRDVLLLAISPISDEKEHFRVRGPLFAKSWIRHCSTCIFHYNIYRGSTFYIYYISYQCKLYWFIFVYC